MSSRRSRSGGIVDGKDVQAIVEIVPEETLLHHPAEIHVGGGDDPHVRLDEGLPADPLKGPVLEDLEELDLGGRGDRADLVEKDGPAVGQFELAQLPPDGAGEGPLLVAEEFAFEEGVGDGAAVDADELHLPPVAVAVDELRQDPLCRSPSPRIKRTVLLVGATSRTCSKTSRMTGFRVWTTSRESDCQKRSRR